MKRAILIGIGALFLCATKARAEESLDQGLWWLYQLQYDKARASFDSFIKAHPDDPAGYFYLTAVDWWHLAQDIEYNLPDIQAKLEEDSQETIKVAQKLYDSAQDPTVKANACLYWGGAEGLWGRWLVTQREWVSAYFAGKRGHKMLKKALELNPRLYDAYLGLGIYDYFTDTLSGVQAVLAAMLIHGDRKRGLEELQMAIDYGEHSRVEAMCFLVEIYTTEEKTPEKALPLAHALRKEFPQSPAMHLIEVSTLYTMKAWDEMLPKAEEFLQESEKEEPWYTRRFIPPARYCMGVAKLWGKHDLEGANVEMEKILAEGEGPSRWITFARLRRGQIYDLRGDRTKALQDYRAVLARPNFWESQEEARQYLRDPFKFAAAPEK
jgi:tetratricopeptide (TPR) repeat protein